jgi:hypothetical protein
MLSISECFLDVLGAAEPIKISNRKSKDFSLETLEWLLGPDSKSTESFCYGMFFEVLIL